MSEERGAIYNEQAYAQGKMIDHSKWQTGEKRLPRNITPSDIDMIFDNRGHQLAIELTRGEKKWTEIQAGQRGVMEGFIICPPKLVRLGVLAWHSVAPHQQICSREHIDGFIPVLHDCGECYVLEPFNGNDRWQRFVFRFYEKPLQLRLDLLRRVAEKTKWGAAA